jgi:hypothetical protein
MIDSRRRQNGSIERAGTPGLMPCPKYPSDSGWHDEAPSCNSWLSLAAAWPRLATIMELTQAVNLGVSNTCQITVQDLYEP